MSAVPSRAKYSDTENAISRSNKQDQKQDIKYKDIGAKLLWHYISITNLNSISYVNRLTPYITSMYGQNFR